MATIVTPGLTSVTSDVPWYLTALITCPKCACQFSVTQEDFVATAGPLGATDTIWHWWRMLTEGDPASAPLALADYHGDPAQIAGPCPTCYYPCSVRGPHYGMAKTQDVVTDPSASAIQQYIQAGATHMFWYHLYTPNVSYQNLCGCFATVSNQVVGIDASGQYAPAVIRTPETLAVNPTYLFFFGQPAIGIASSEAQSRDPALCATLATYGLVP
jgi:hypothetical protein